MPTENRRVATYLPSHIDEKLTAFKSDRGIKGDSQALLAILSEFFGVGHEVAHQGSSDLVQRIGDLESKIFQIKDSLLSELKGELLKQLKGELLSELKSEPSEEYVAPGQLQLIPDGSSLDELPSESRNEPSAELKPMTAAALSKRMTLSVNAVSNRRSDLKDSPEKFAQWTKEKDPDHIEWKYNPKDRLYYPVSSES